MEFLLTLTFSLPAQQQGGESAAAWKSMKDSLPPAWVEQIEKVDEDIAKIQLKSEFRSSNIFSRHLVSQLPSCVTSSE